MKNKNDKLLKLIKRELTKNNLLLSRVSGSAGPQLNWVPKRLAAELYGVSERTIYNWYKSGGIMSKQINGKRYYSIKPLITQDYGS